jgi:hypothetical protein
VASGLEMLRDPKPLGPGIQAVKVREMSHGYLIESVAGEGAYLAVCLPAGYRVSALGQDLVPALAS